MVAGFLLSGMTAASAGFITANETGLDAIFSQSGFGSNSIDIRFNPGQTVVVDAALLSLDNDAEINSLASLSVSSSPTVNMFFVDAITYCGVTGSFAGCGSYPGNFIALVSSWAANTTYGANLEAHELGHNLGLDHVSSTVPPNLMNPIISTSGALTASQITSILSSVLVQTAIGGQRFLSITPIAVVSSIPEPQTWAMLSLGLLGIAGWVQRRKQCAA